MPADPELFSADVQRCYAATLRENLEDLPPWPAGCRGAGNAFLVLVGPSMGGAPKGETPVAGTGVRPYRRPMRIAADAMSLDWGGHRKARWLRLCSELLGGEQYVSALTALMNLDWRHSTNESDIPEESLQRGLDDHVWSRLLTVRPRIVCALTKRVWKLLSRRVAELQVPFPDSPVDLPFAPIVFRLPAATFPTVLVKPHNHPSRALSYADISELGRATRWFLESPARVPVGR